ncbi:MAG: sigma-70 family RNA polymerase sigma factor [Cyclobacteriaceae bacterium]
MDHVHAVDKLYKKDFGKLVTCVLSFSKDIDLATAEDIVQEAFSSALVDWNEKEIPINPSGWLYTVCRNKALNFLKKTKVDSISFDVAFEANDTTSSESPITDQQLKLLFTCAHPDLPPKSQVAITLKYVVNLKVEAIAKLLGLTVDGVDKILIRARQKIKSSNLLRDPLDSNVMKLRLPTVHKVIYLFLMKAINHLGEKKSFVKSFAKKH